ncbi:MAG: DUF4301 domain-containing protein, partial [Marinilabiliales bacterium]
MIFTDKDIQQIEDKGLSKDKVEKQIKNFKNGFPYLNILKPATIGDGILLLNNHEIQAYIKLYEDVKPKSLKFVPASGAASRMFKFLFEFYETAKDQYNRIEEITDENVRKFFEELDHYAFYKELKTTIESAGVDIDQLLKQLNYKEI